MLTRALADADRNQGPPLAAPPGPTASSDDKSCAAADSRGANAGSHASPIHGCAALPNRDPTPVASASAPGMLSWRWRQWPALVKGTSQVVVSQVALGLAGVLTLPVLGRTLGPEGYGDFSLFVTLLGVATYQDVARQLLIHEQSQERSSPADLDALTRLSTVLIVVLALAVGTFVLEPSSAAALLVVTLLHGLSSRDYATLAVSGHVGSVTALRNSTWAIAFGLTALLSFVVRGPLTYLAPFVAASAITWLGYRRLAGWQARIHLTAGPTGAWWARASGWAHLRCSASWPRYRRAGLDLLGFTLASSVIASADRILLEKTASGQELGIYCGAADLALRVHILSSALAAALYPTLARALREEGYERAARRFVRIASWTAVAHFVVLLGLLLAQGAVLDAFLGGAFVDSRPVFALLVVAVFVQTFGFLLTPWQRAQGDFQSQRLAYGRAMVVMVAAGLLLVPAYGAVGAAVAYLCSRVAEIQLVARELRRMPRELLPRRHLALLGAMLLILLAAAAWRLAETS